MLCNEFSLKCRNAVSSDEVRLTVKERFHADDSRCDVGDDYSRRVPGTSHERTVADWLAEIRHFDHVVACNQPLRYIM